MSSHDGKVSKARTRLLDAATRIFYTEGVNSVGVDRVIEEAGVTRATLYRHFPSKQNLITTYVEEVDRADRAQIEAIIAGEPSPAKALRAIAESIAEQIAYAHFRGCAFLNAAAEFPDPDDPVHHAVLVHRSWFLETILGLFAQLDDTSLDDAGRRFVMLRDGAMAAGCLAEPDEVRRTFLGAVDALLA